MAEGKPWVRVRGPSVWPYKLLPLIPTVFGGQCLVATLSHFSQASPASGFCFLAASTLLYMGFLFREIARGFFDDIKGYVSTTVLVDSAVPILIIANYHALSRAFASLPHLAPLRPGRMVPVFGALVTFAETRCFYTAIRATIAAADADVVARAVRAVGASLALQLVAIVLLFALIARFHRSVARAAAKGMGKGSEGGGGSDAVGGDQLAYRRVNSLLRTLYISVLLLLLRTLHRAAVVAGGLDAYAFAVSAGGSTEQAERAIMASGVFGFVARHEWFQVVLEEGALTANVIMWMLRHPRNYLPHDGETYLAKRNAARTEVALPMLEPKRKI